MMEWLRYGARHYPNRICMNGYTYEEICRWVIYAARSMESLDVSRIAVLSDNSVTMAIYIFAAMLAHKEVLLLNVHLKMNEIEAQLSQLGVTTVLHSVERRHQVPDSATSVVFESCESIISAPEFEDTFDWTFNDMDVAAIMNTSATTGQFKSVPLRWGQIRAHVKASRSVLGVTDEDNWLMVLPLFHVSGLSILMRSLYNGTAVTVLPKYDEDKVLDLINRNQINMMSLVPTILTRLEPNIQHHNLRVILLGGEFIPRSLIEACLKKNLPIYKTYGMTETFSQSVTFSVLDHPDKAESVGLPLPGMTVRIVDADEEGVGEIHLKGPMVMSGYINREPIDGDFNTEDMGYVDEDGFVYILNRRKDLIISGGENIYPKEIEDLLYTLDAIKECAVVPMPHPKWGQVPALFLAFNDNQSLGKDEILAFLRDRLAKYKIPQYVQVMDSLPRNGTGKIMRNTLIPRER
ncbi:o-succinylbenzoate--CoA ligase [Veillonella denticariosi]|uniref:o-succinylbenzoate--CoA ligase n=1 Tax=Veillonella denticariosi TaxID=419208 RepID=UPI0024937F85|nr:o-succinylbenzoate--CoA ligase [Veillonella denticariosi]